MDTLIQKVYGVFFLGCLTMAMSELCGKVTVRLKTLVDTINAPTVIKTAVLPGDAHESIVILTQQGQIWLLHEGAMEKMLDISYENKGPVLKLGNNGSMYDERGLLGIEFHPLFKKNGRFFLYYSTNNHEPKLPHDATANPCEPATLSTQWAQQDHYDHSNVLEEWQYTSSREVKLVRRLLDIKHPYSNHNSINNLFWSYELDKLLLLTGDGGFRDGPFNLSQDDAFLHGKVIAINVDSPLWKKAHAQPIARFDELPKSIQKLVSVVVKGVRNWSGMTEFVTPTSRIKFFGQPGQETVEAIYAFKSFFKTNQSGKRLPINIGWRAWEGSLPLLQNLDCKTGSFTLSHSNLKSVVYYQEAINTAVERKLPYCEYYHQDNRPHKVQGVSITGQEVYRGDAIKGLKDYLVIIDWAHSTGAGFPKTMPRSPGIMLKVPIDEKVDTLHEYEEVRVMHDFKKPAFFISIGSNREQTRLFLGTYQKLETGIPGLGTVFEIVP